MKKVFRASSVLATALAAGLLLAACGTPNSGGSSAKQQNLATPVKKSGTLSILTKFADPKYAPYFVDTAKAYEAANPGVKIALQQVGDQPYKDKIRVLTASHNLPDIYFSWAGDFANKFVRGGLAADLTSVIGPNTAWGKTFSQAALKTFQDNGKAYGVPIDLDAKYMVYSKAAFTKAGLSGPPASFEELVTDCGKLKAAGYTPIAFGNQFG
ncbi:MAG: raffinose/stachyose/melibiose transport system substrate-binding protein, partial [Actinomycetota bacterium]|nr:raffinose/stachyose/melibiose transport system substrate-binding protein [Actinomycetota bacterium]